MYTPNLQQLNLTDLRDLLNKVLEHLKDKHITVLQIETVLALNNLAKMRYERYKNKNFNVDTVTRTINSIKQYYKLIINITQQANNKPDFEISDELSSTNQPWYLYIYYYYSNKSHQIMQARWEVSPDFKHAQLSFYDSSKEQIVYKPAPATVTHIDNNLYVQTLAPQISLLILHASKNCNLQTLSCLVGTYNCVSIRTDSPVSGKTVLQKMPSDEVFMEQIKQDVPLPIKKYLQSHQSTVDRMFFSIDELVL